MFHSKFAVTSILIFTGVTYPCSLLAKQLQENESDIINASCTNTNNVTEGRTAQVKTIRAYSTLSFEANQGQTNDKVKFLARGRDYTVFLTSDEVVIASHTKTLPLRIRFVGAQSSPMIKGKKTLPGKSNYLIGNNPHKWRTEIPHFSRVQYHEIYPGVDLVYYGNQQQLEYDLVLAQGVDPRVIRLEVKG